MPQRFDELCRIFPPESEGKQCRSAVSQGHSVRDVFTTLEQKGLHHKSRKKRELRSQIYAARRRSNMPIQVKDKAIKLKFSSESPWHGWITSAPGEFMSEFYPWIIKKDNFNSRALNLPLAVEFMHSIIMFRNIQLICTSQKPFKGEFN